MGPMPQYFAHLPAVTRVRTSPFLFAITKFQSKKSIWHIGLSLHGDAVEQQITISTHV
jgi:hypothetical protein